MTALSGVRNSWLICAISSLRPVVGAAVASLSPSSPAAASGRVSVSSATPVPVAIRNARCHPGSPPMRPLAAAAGSCQAVIARMASAAR